MGLKIDNSLVDTQLSKMEAAIKNITSFAAAGNLAVKQLMEHEVAAVITTKVASMGEPKWTMVMAKNVRQVLSQAVETLADTPKQEERKLNLCFMGFKAKEDEIEKELVQRLNIELLQGQMRLCAKVVVATRQRLATAQASTSAAGGRLGAMLLKFTTNEDRQAALRGCKGLTRINLGLDEDFMPA
jgi:hypothetical protein